MRASNMSEDAKFRQWVMRDDPTGDFKGVHRHIIMASIAKAQGMEWSNLHGLLESKGTSSLTDPNQIVRTLLPGYTNNPVELSVSSILNYIYETHKGNNEKIEELIGEAAEILAEEHGIKLPMPDDVIVHETNDTDEYFLARLRDRMVNMGYEPLMEKTNLTEATKLRDMNHLEDLVLEEGTKGLIKSIKILRAFAEGSAHSQTTIKWDGSPAIIFGRDEKGQFFLTDKSGYAANG